MEVVQSGEVGGFEYLTAITSGTTYALDLSAFIGRYVKIYVNQDAYIGWRAVGSSDDFAAAAFAPSLTTVTRDPIAAGSQGANRYVRASSPVLLVRAQSTNVTQLIGKVTSPLVSA